MGDDDLVLGIYEIGISFLFFLGKGIRTRKCKADIATSGRVCSSRRVRSDGERFHDDDKAEEDDDNEGAAVFP